MTEMKREWEIYTTFETKANRYTSLLEEKNKERKNELNWFRVMWWTQFIIDKNSKHLIRAWISGFREWFRSIGKWNGKPIHAPVSTKSVNNNGGKNHFNSVSSIWQRWNGAATVGTKNGIGKCVCIQIVASVSVSRCFFFVCYRHDTEFHARVVNLESERRMRSQHKCYISMNYTFDWMNK